jgi:hypothetical protein
MKKGWSDFFGLQPLGGPSVAYVAEKNSPSDFIFSG